MTDENENTELSGKQKKKAFKIAAKNMLANELSSYYPKCFNCNEPKPLKLLIRNDILVDHPEFDKDILREAMQQYCNTKEYFLASVEKSVQRINLAGEGVAKLTKKEFSYCEMRLSNLAKKEEKERLTEVEMKEGEERHQKNLEIKANKAKKRAEEKVKKSEEKAKKAAKNKADKVKQPIKVNKSQPVIVKKKQPVIVTKKQPEIIIKPKRRPTLSLKR